MKNELITENSQVIHGLIILFHKYGFVACHRSRSHCKNRVKENWW